MALSKIDLANMVENQMPQSLIADNINFRNIIINGDMSIAQRGTSFSSQTAEHYVVDRFKMFVMLLVNNLYSFYVSPNLLNCAPV